MEKFSIILLFISAISICLASFLIIENSNLRLESSFLRELVNQKDAKIASDTQTIYSLNQNSSLDKREIFLLNNSIQNYSIQLYNSNEKILDLELELNATKSSLTHSTDQLSQTRLEISNLTSELSKIENSVDSSISWFKDNAFLPSSFSSFESDLSFDCVHSMIINLGCLPYVMQRDFNFTYRLDNSDKLYSVFESVVRSGGDCEDYSLFIMASLNSLKRDNSKYQIESWVPSNDTYTIYQSASKYWFYQGTPRNLGNLKDLYPMMICFTTMYNGTDLEGHCTVALSKNKLVRTSDVRLLDDAEVFEPQNGQYLGKIGSDFIVCQIGDVDCNLKLNRISLVATDSDLFEFNSGKWSSYYDYRQQIQSLLFRLSNSK